MNSHYRTMTRSALKWTVPREVEPEGSTSKAIPTQGTAPTVPFCYPGGESENHGKDILPNLLR